MKKFRTILTLLLCLTLAICFTACGGKKGGDDGDKPGPKPPEPEGPTATHTAVVKDQNGTPLPGFWMELCYIRNYETIRVSTAMSDEHGVAYFLNFEPQENTKYRVRSASLYGADKKPVPYAYSPETMYADCDAKTGIANFVFRYLPQKFPGGQTPQIAYAREDVDGTAEETENKPLKADITAGGEAYFAFSPYVTPETVGTSDENPETGNRYTEEEARQETARRLNAATAAATGVYNISYTVSPAADVTFRMYSGTRASMSLDPETGKPTQVLQTATGNTVSVHLNSLQVRGEVVFGLSSATAASATVTVTRAGDATEPTVDDQTIQATATQKWTEIGKDNEVLINMPTDGSKTAVKGADGYYRLGSANGALIYAQLGTKMSRLGDYAVIDMYKQTNMDGVAAGDGAYTFSWLEANDKWWEAHPSARHTHRYGDFVRAYADLLNPDGAYPVNEELKTFLNLLVPTTFAAAEITDSDNAWMAACQYYGTVEGSMRSPVALELGKTVTLGAAEHGLDKLYVRYTATESGVYCISATGAATTNFIPAVKTDERYAYGGGYYAVLAAGERFDCILDGAAAMQVTASSVSTMWAPETGRGDTADNAFDAVVGPNPFRADANGVYLAFTPADGEDYRIELGKGATLVYDGNTYDATTPLEIENAAGTKHVLHLTSTADTAWMLIRKVGSFRVDTPKTVTLPQNAAGIFIFTAPQDGLYTGSCGAADFTWCTGEQSEGMVQYLYLKADESAEFSVDYLSDDREVTVTLTRVKKLHAGENNVIFPATPAPIELTFDGAAGTYRLEIGSPRGFQARVSEVTVTVDDTEYVLNADADWQTLIELTANTVITVQGDGSYYITLTKM